jgi:hypothetical protein
MADVTKKIKLTESPKDLLESAKQHILNYYIGMVRLDSNDFGEDAILIGSGTLVDFKGTKCILTAQHVIDGLPKKGKIGFIISDKLHKHVLEVQNLLIVEIEKGEDDSLGPDLGIIVLPQSHIGNIKAHKSFYNIQKYRERMINAPPENDMGVWCISGIPDIETNVVEPRAGFDRVKAFFGFCGFGGIGNQYETGSYDYFDFEVQYNDRTDSPISFGGVSGGGLWQVLIDQKESGELVMKEAILSGVAFYQTDLVDDKRTIKCHGRNSIFRNAYNKMKLVS